MTQKPHKAPTKPPKIYRRTGKKHRRTGKKHRHKDTKRLAKVKKNSYLCSSKRQKTHYYDNDNNNPKAHTAHNEIKRSLPLREQRHKTLHRTKRPIRRHQRAELGSTKTRRTKEERPNTKSSRPILNRPSRMPTPYTRL